MPVLPVRFLKRVLYEGARFTLDNKSALVYRLTPEAPNLYAPAGDVVFYDGDRHLERRLERKRTALAWALWLPTVPLMPLLGLLPQSTKEKLVGIGVDPARATELSLMLEWLLLTATVIAYLGVGGVFTPAGFALGAVALFLLVDIAHRVTAGAGGETPGLGSVAGEFARLARRLADTWRGKDRLLDDDDPP